jgi:hypothetical protein
LRAPDRATAIACEHASPDARRSGFRLPHALESAGKLDVYPATPTRRTDLNRLLLDHCLCASKRWEKHQRDRCEENGLSSLHMR